MRRLNQRVAALAAAMLLPLAAQAPMAQSIRSAAAAEDLKARVIVQYRADSDMTRKQAMTAGVGAEIDVELGGHTDQSMGKPVKARALVKMLSDGVFKNDGPMNAGVLSDMGPTAVLRIGGIDVVTISNRIQTTDLQVFLSQGIDPRAKDVLVVKSVQHFRAAYAPIAREIVLVDSGGICSPDITRLKFTKLRRPIWPLDGVNDPYAGARS